MTESQDKIIGTDEAVTNYILNGDATKIRKTDGGSFALPWIGQPIPSGHTVFGDLYAMPAATIDLLESHDRNLSLRKWLIEETLPTFKKQIEDAGWRNARIGSASILRDPYTAKPYVLFYVAAKCFSGDAPVPFE